MRQIKASEVQPGMTIRWEGRGFIHEGLVERTTAGVHPKATRVLSGQFGMDIPGDAEVTVLTESQPEEPTAFGARVVAGGYEFLLSNGGRRPWKARLDGNRYSWAEVCGLGPVIVIDADPSWTVPEGTPDATEVPERIEEWPEDDTALRPYKWRGRDGYIWKWLAAASEWECYDAVGNGMVSGGRPSYGPWTHATDA